jgi:hypothetical protein
MFSRVEVVDDVWDADVTHGWSMGSFDQAR